MTRPLARPYPYPHLHPHPRYIAPTIRPARTDPRDGFALAAQAVVCPSLPAELCWPRCIGCIRFGVAERNLSPALQFAGRWQPQRSLANHSVRCASFSDCSFIHRSTQQQLLQPPTSARRLGLRDDHDASDCSSFMVLCGLQPEPARLPASLAAVASGRLRAPDSYFDGALLLTQQRRVGVAIWHHFIHLAVRQDVILAFPLSSSPGGAVTVGCDPGRLQCSRSSFGARPIRVVVVLLQGRSCSLLSLWAPRAQPAAPTPTRARLPEVVPASGE